MNPTALPTPFDIAAPPLVAYVPGSLEWVCLIGACLLLVMFVLLRRRRPHDPQFAPFEVCLKALEQLNPQDPALALRLQKLLKALLSEASGVEVRSRTATEIANQVSQYAPITAICVRLEEILYCANSVGKSPTQLLAAAKDTITAIYSSGTNQGESK